MNTARWILLVWLCGVALSTLLVGWVVLWHRMKLERDAWRLQAAFRALRFDTPAGPVAGDALTVVKIAYRNDPSPQRLQRDGPDRWNSLWYAAGPGPSYFLAVCTFDAQVPARPHWAVQTLDEPSLRAALTDDFRAQMLAFGEAIEA